MPLLTVNPSGLAAEVPSGMTLLEALLTIGAPITYKCNGKAECGNCHLFVQEGRKSLSKTERLENEKLDSIVGVGSKSRLACQARLGNEPVTVELLGFASGR